MTSSEFYEDDEPLADVLAAFEAGEKSITRAPLRGETQYYAPGTRAAGHRVTTAGAPVSWRPEPTHVSSNR